MIYIPTHDELIEMGFKKSGFTDAMVFVISNDICIYSYESGEMFLLGRKRLLPTCKKDIEDLITMLTRLTNDGN